MKPVVIIAIAVGCSVAAVFGVLFGMQAYQEKVFIDEATRIQNFNDDVVELTLSYLPVAEECGADTKASGINCMKNIKNDFQKSLYQITDQYGYSDKRQQVYEQTVIYLEDAHKSGKLSNIDVYDRLMSEWILNPGG
jgi:hypothetical protein